MSLRYANVYGPRQDPEGEAGVVAIFIQKLLNNEQPIINGNGRQTRDFVFVEDVAEANLAAMGQDIQGMYNVGTGEETSVNELFRIFVRHTASTCKEVMGRPKLASRRGASLIQASSGKNYPGSQLNSVKGSSVPSIISANGWARSDTLFMLGTHAYQRVRGQVGLIPRNGSVYLD